MSRQIVEAMFNVIDWKNPELAFIDCPGKHFHTGKNAKRDCRVNLDKAPTIYCLHNSCSGVIEEANYKMRRAFWENNPLPKREFSDQEKAKIKKDVEEKKKEQVLRDWAGKNKEKIFEKHSWPIADVLHESPFMSDSPDEDSSLMLGLYQPDDVLWIGEPTDSGSESKKPHFKTVKQWHRENISYHFTCPSVFKPGSFSRSNENVVSRPYMVIESDTLTPDQTCSLYKWMRGFMELKAIVYSGGKSYHGWFAFPSIELFNKLKIVLPELGCDEALFKASQPVRMPGVKRNDTWQCIYWFNK